VLGLRFEDDQRALWRYQRPRSCAIQIIRTDYQLHVSIEAAQAGSADQFDEQLKSERTTGVSARLVTYDDLFECSKSARLTICLHPK